MLPAELERVSDDVDVAERGGEHHRAGVQAVHGGKVREALDRELGGGLDGEVVGDAVQHEVDGGDVGGWGEGVGGLVAAQRRRG